MYITGFSSDWEKENNSARAELRKFASFTVFIFNKNPLSANVCNITCMDTNAAWVLTKHNTCVQAKKHIRKWVYITVPVLRKHVP